MRRFLNSRGGMEMYIIVIVIIGAFLLAGGMIMVDTSVTSPDPINSTGNTNGSDWKIEFNVRSCDPATQIASTQTVIKGPENGYFTLQFGNGTDVLSQGFTNPPSATYTLKTFPAENSQPVTITVYSGGTSDSSSGTEVWSGGTQMVTQNFPATGGC